MNEQTLELQIKSKSQEALSTVDTLISKLTGLKSKVESIDNTLKTGTIKTTVTNIDNLKSATDKATSSANKLGKALSLSGAYLGVKRLTTQFLDWMNLAIDRTEQMNLFNVVFKNIEKDGVKTFSTLGKEATQFQYKLNEAFGTNMTETLKYQGLFQSMGENVGIPDKYASIMSETMTKFTYDLASLYNKSEATTGEALRAGVYAGQTKPLRGYGIDVTQTSMQPVLNSLGIDKQVKELSQAEKEILRYIVTLRQGQIAMGDFANTVESPANQLKIFKQQLAEAKVALTSLFIGTFGKILPYANAILMVIKEVSKAIANMFGIKLTDYNSSIATQEDAYIDLGDSIDGATKKVKELKRQTLGFDEIHNINENKDTGSSGSSGSGIVGGIDQRLLDAIKGYDNGMDKIRMKATEIRDRIMEWLGFHKEIDPLTGETVWKLNKGLTNLKLIGGLITAWVGLKIISKLGKLKDSISIINSQTGKTKTGFDKLSTALNKILVGTVGLVISYKTIQDSTKNLVIQTDKWYKSLLSLSLGFGGAVASGALMGSIFGPMGTGIGAITGAFVGLIGVMDGYHKGLESLAKSNIYGELTLTAEQLNEITSGIGNNFERETSIINNYKNSISTLESTWKTSITTVEQYGLMYGTMQQKISNEDIPNIISSIKTLGNDTKNIIGESTQYSLDLWTSMMSNTTSITKEEQGNIIKTISENGQFMTNEVENIQNNITTTYQNAIATRGYLTDEEYNYISEQLGKLRELTNISMSTAKTDLTMLQNDINSGRLNLSEEGYNQLISQIKEKEQLATDEAWDIRRKAYENADQQKKIMELAGKSAEEIQQAYNAQIKVADENYSKAIAENQKQVLNLMETLEKTIETKRNDYTKNAGKWGQTLYDKIMGSYSKIYSAEETETIKQYDKMLNNLENYKSDLSTKYKELATDTIDGYIQGLSNSQKKLTDKTHAVMSAAPTTAKDVLDSHSPSKVFDKIGQDTIQGYINGINNKKTQMLNTVKTLMNELDKSFSSKTYKINISSNVESSFNSILNKLESFANKFRTGINNLLSNMSTSMNNVYVGNDNKIKYKSMPYISVPKFANGGMPEDGLFFANHKELVGQFNNGNTVVANNLQIEKGIEEAAYRGYIRAITDSGINSGQASEIDVHVHTDEGTIIDRIEQKTKQTGVFPFTIPIQ